MADIHFSITTAAITLTAGVAKTVLQLVAPTNQRNKVHSWGVTFAGTSGTAVPVLVRLLRQTSAGTSSALTPMLLRPAAETIQSTARHTATVEPSAGDLLWTMHVHPQTGHDRPITPGQEIVLAGGTRLGIECTAAAGVDVIAWMLCEE